ncbi:MAG: methionyl-tRNA formyltransferase [Desulfotomaculaceae bacterium]
MRVLFMGTPDFAVPSLVALILGGYKIAGVVTQPDKPKGRGRKLAQPPVKEIAQIYGLDVFQPENIRDTNFIEILRRMDLDIIIVVAYGKLIPPGILGIPKKGCINVHASLLPQYRGAAPIHRAIINGETKTGISIMCLSQCIDAGDVIRQAPIEIHKEDNVGVIHDHLAEMGAKLLLETLSGIKDNSVKYTPQDDSRATYAPVLTRKDEMISWERSTEDILNQIRGLDPWPGAFTSLNSKNLKIWSAKKKENQNSDNARPGCVLESDKSELLIKTGDGVISVVELQLQGLRRMDAADFLRGRPITPGTVLGAFIEKRE